ncbi:hypothetical protein [uncultured Thalassolituus sp.]|uniref:hypothetical protein n=1 Tax=uncultured Thalassolituus sp. TaxID=285273 RepID=UPI002627AF3D|nr:hypothetical protein [uncultured Thalassolituus sp.]
MAELVRAAAAGDGEVVVGAGTVAQMIGSMDQMTELMIAQKLERMPEEATRASVMTLEAQIKTGHDLKVICQGQTFSQQVLGAALIDEVRNAVSAARRQDAGQPVYLSDIHLHDNHHLIQHLQYRQKLERLLNRISEGHVMRPGEAQTSL